MMKSYLGFTRREMRGFVFLLPVLAFLYAVPYYIKSYHRSIVQASYLEYIEENQTFFSQSSASPFISQEEKPKQGQEPGKSDKSNTSSQKLKKPLKPALSKISFSETTAVELQMVRGVGPVLSERISKYKAKLGGFHAPEQLLEVYGVEAELAEEIYAVFPFKSKINSKININLADFKQLINHPYIEYGAAKVILAYREQHGNYVSADDLLKIRIFNESWVNRIAPYLEF
jgi:DNA uptake protein ComE-like DNA-binding protein